MVGLGKEADRGRGEKLGREGMVNGDSDRLGEDGIRSELNPSEKRGIGDMESKAVGGEGATGTEEEGLEKVTTGDSGILS